ncbi:MAG: hypothetical protein QXL17_06625 [Candidatus Thermoplasmatota archaeon]
MRHSRAIFDRNGLAGVIEALLLVALVAIVISVIQLQYIPQVMEQREAEHMDQISNQFATLKSMIDLQAITNSSAPISTMITLGSRELPYFVTVGSSGTLRTYEYNDSYLNISYNYFVCPLTSIQYESENYYFIDQSYILEGGGIIVAQASGEPVMRVDPSIHVVNRTNDLDIYWTLPIIKGISGKNMTSGNGKCFIRTNWSKGQVVSIPDANSIYIRTRYPNAWYEAMQSRLSSNVQYDVGTTYLEITEKTKRINVYLSYYYIYTQIGIGWIK